MQIDEGQYIKVLKKLADSKVRSLKSEKNIFVKKRKLQLYLQQKGFEMDLIKDVVNLLF